MEFLIGVLVLVVGLLVSIALHELGHMIPAKRFGVLVSEYFVGFGPRLWSRRRGETEYGIKAIPLGGYVRLVGMVPPASAVKPVRIGGWAGRLIEDTRAQAEEEIPAGQDHRAFYHLTWWRKAIVMLGGPLVNLVLAILIFTAVLSFVGLPTQTLQVASVVQCVPAAGTSECTADDPAAPAAAAGIEAGDVFVSADGVALDEWTDLTAYVASHPGEEIALVVDRGGELVDLTVTPASRTVYAADDEGEPLLDAAGEPVTEEIGYLGVYSLTEAQQQPVWSGAELTWQYLGQTMGVIIDLPAQVYHVGRAAVGLEERTADSVIGVVGVGRISGEIASADVDGYSMGERMADMLMLLGGLNLALFAFNMIPLVPLDGGHVASALWQGIKNGWARLRGAARPRPVDVARMMPVAYGVFALLLVMGAVLVYADIVAPVTIA
ncbi:M50 family metallopeptidase [Demequina zhanjiangensis]|uniref:Site-2 protease family protein n=1 Tax=Demequina zhanjiangensis TaxID=3051659 RepID=A0ABT8G372_9MICO|nr:site-2 protease family protein [Demequina sp. SYSU T00b26]MDN4473594.1 site-2 protease family protein [Demequina sp. SYSU T00b26]